MYKVQECMVQLVETFFFFLQLRSQIKTNIINEYYMNGQFQTALKLIDNVINVVGCLVINAIGFPVINVSKT